MPDAADAEHQPSHHVPEWSHRRGGERRTRSLPGGTFTFSKFHTELELEFLIGCAVELLSLPFSAYPLVSVWFRQSGYFSESGSFVLIHMK